MPELLVIAAKWLPVILTAVIAIFLACSEEEKQEYAKTLIEVALMLAIIAVLYFIVDSWSVFIEEVISG